MLLLSQAEDLPLILRDGEIFSTVALNLAPRSADMMCKGEGV